MTVNLVNVEYRFDFFKKIPIISLYFRDGEQKIIKEVEYFKPYFYSTNKIATNAIKIPDQFGNTHYEYITQTLTNRKTMKGEPVYKIQYNNPRLTSIIRTYFNDNGYESDVEFVRRFMIDNVTKLEKASYRKLVIDIETTTDYGFSVAENPIEKITLVSIYDNILNKLATFALLPEGVKLEDVDSKIPRSFDLIDRDGKFIKRYEGPIAFFEDESEMLKMLFATWKKLDPDLNVGWNVYFDIIYLFARAKYLKIDYTSIFGFVRFEPSESRSKYGQAKKQPTTRIQGQIIFDLLDPYKRIKSKELPSYSLEYVSDVELNMDHAKLRVSNFSKFWRENFVEFVIYNRRDVGLCNSVEEKTKIIDTFEDIRVLSLLPRLDMCTVWSKVIDNIVLTKFPDYVYPMKVFVNKTTSPEKILEDRGGYVKEPLRGLHEDVDVLDFFSMYPNIYIMFNLSPETICNPSEIPEKDRYKLSVFYDGQLHEFWVRTDIKGILPRVVEYMLNLRQYYTKMRDSTTGYEREKWAEKRYMIKTTINAVYGVTLYESFRLHKIEVGRGITYIGRELDKYIHERLKNDYPDHPVIYGDTDSTFIKIKDKTLANEIITKINTIYVPDFIEIITHRRPRLEDITLHVEMDHHYDYLMLIEKKQYIGFEKGEWVFVGVAPKRSSTPEIISNGMKEGISKYFFTKEDETNTLKIKETVQFTIQYSNFIRNCQDINLLRIPMKLEREITGYQKNIPVVKAVRNHERLFGKSFRAGEKFYSVHIRGEKKWEPLAFDLLDTEKEQKILSLVDKEKYVKDFVHKLMHTLLLSDLEKDTLAKCGIVSKSKRTKVAKESILVLNIVGEEDEH